MFSFPFEFDQILFPILFDPLRKINLTKKISLGCSLKYWVSCRRKAAYSNFDSWNMISKGLRQSWAASGISREFGNIGPTRTSCNSSSSSCSKEIRRGEYRIYGASEGALWSFQGESAACDNSYRWSCKSFEWQNHRAQRYIRSCFWRFYDEPPATHYYHPYYAARLHGNWRCVRICARWRLTSAPIFSVISCFQQSGYWFNHSSVPHLHKFTPQFFTPASCVEEDEKPEIRLPALLSTLSSMEFSAEYFKAKLRIRDIVDAIGEDWKKLMRQLGITEDELANIQALYPDNELEQAKHTLALWVSAKTTSSALLSF